MHNFFFFWGGVQMAGKYFFEKIYTPGFDVSANWANLAILKYPLNLISFAGTVGSERSGC